MTDTSAMDRTETIPVGPGEPAELHRVNAPQPFLHGFMSTARDVIAFRELLGNLVRKELKIKYKDSALGYFWSLLLPLVTLCVYWFVIGNFLNAGTIPYYGVFIFAGLSMWTLFSEIVSTATSSIVYNAGLVKKVYFPRELFPLAATGAALVNFAFQFVILLSAVIVAGILSGQWPDLALLPMPILAMVALVLFASALGMLLAAANVYLRDIQHLIAIVLMMWFWMTPIVYSVTRVGDKLPRVVYDAYLLNPMASVTFAFQKFFWPQGDGTVFQFTGDIYLRLWATIAFSLVFFWFAQRVFARAQGNFAQEL